MHKKPKGFKRAGGKYQHICPLLVYMGGYDEYNGHIIVEYNLKTDYEADPNQIGQINTFELQRFLDYKIGKNNYSFSIEFFKRDGGSFPFIEYIYIQNKQTYEIHSLKLARLEKIWRIRRKNLGLEKR